MQSRINERTHHQNCVVDSGDCLWQTTTTAPTPTTSTSVAEEIQSEKTVQHLEYKVFTTKSTHLAAAAAAIRQEGSVRNNNICSGAVGNIISESALPTTTKMTTTIVTKNGRTGRPPSPCTKMTLPTLRCATNSEEDEGGGDGEEIGSTANDEARNGDCTKKVDLKNIDEHVNIDDIDIAGAFSLTPSMRHNKTSNIHEFIDSTVYDNDICAHNDHNNEEEEDDDEEEVAGAVHSNCTSMNNSTENLSYASDIFYGDDLLILGAEADNINDCCDVADIDAESVSLNSDDCVYAYRGDGAEFDLDAMHIWRNSAHNGVGNVVGMLGGGGIGGAHGGIDGRGGRNDPAVDDETDFLEMDFEPDPLSEADYGYGEAGNNAIGGGGGAISLSTALTSDAFLQLQRCEAYCGVPSGRHSALGQTSPIDFNAALPPMISVSGGGGGDSSQQRRLFSSPTTSEDHLLPPPTMSLQAQSILGKNFARISLHLDRIRDGGGGGAKDNDDDDGDDEDGYGGDSVGVERVSNTIRNGTSENGAITVMNNTNDGGSNVEHIGNLPHNAHCGSSSGSVSMRVTSAHSLPSTLHTHCSSRDGQRDVIDGNSTPDHKVTGAKPKRLSTFSASSSTTSSKNSSKSRSSVRCAAPQPLYGSASFDERSVSCSEFRSTGIGCPLSATATAMTAERGNDEQFGMGIDEAICLDCLERDFLATTIGKTPERRVCDNCHARRGGVGAHRLSFLGRSLSGVGGSQSDRCSDLSSLRCRSGSPTAFFPQIDSGNDVNNDNKKGYRNTLFFGSSDCAGTEYSSRSTTSTTSADLQCGSNSDAFWSTGERGTLDSRERTGRRRGRDILIKRRAEQDLRTLDWNARHATFEFKNTRPSSMEERGGMWSKTGQQPFVTMTAKIKPLFPKVNDNSNDILMGEPLFANNGKDDAPVESNWLAPSQIRNQRRRRRSMCDNHKDGQILGNFSTDVLESVMISKANLCEDSLVQALDQLHVAYNADLLKAHWKNIGNMNNNNNNIAKKTSQYNNNNKTSSKSCKDMRDFILRASKRPWNPPKLRRLIDLVTRQQVDVQFKEDSNSSTTETVEVSFADILQQWERHKQLDSLRHLSKRFAEANVLGKIANIIRLEQNPRTSTSTTATTSTITNSECPAAAATIRIPQYYPSSSLILSIRKTR